MGIGDNLGVNKTGSDSLYVKKKKEEDLKLQKQDTTALIKAELHRLNNTANSEQKTPTEFTFGRFSTDNMTDEEIERLSQEWLATPSPASNAKTAAVTAAQSQVPVTETSDAENTQTPTEEQPPEETQEPEQNPPPAPGSPDRYKGENKPASTANWADLNGKYFEVIDEPDANGKLPTRPIHGEIKVEGEAKNGENPKKFTITDKDNGQVYTFELDETAEGKVVYTCTSGAGGAYSAGNSYELRTINGVPMLVQMNGTEGYGSGLRATAPAAAATETPETPTNPTEPTAPTNPANPTDPAGQQPVEGENLTPEQREAKIQEDAAAIEVDLTPKKKIDEELSAKAEAISKAIEEAPAVAADIKKELEAFWTSNDKARELLSKITPENAVYVIAKYPEIADKIDDVMGMDTVDIYKSLYTPLKARLKELGLADPFGDRKTLSKTSNLDGMKEWIKKASLAILETEQEISKQALNNYKEAKEEQEYLEAAKPIIEAANHTLAEAANADPKLEVKYKEGDEFVQLPDGRQISVDRNEQGEITGVWIDKDSDDKNYDIQYTERAFNIYTNPESEEWKAMFSNDNRYDFNKILELAKRIFGEKPAP